MKLLLLLAVGLDLAWAQQDQSQVPVQQGFSSDQVGSLNKAGSHPISFPGLCHLEVS